ncbi:cytidylate kinase-like family protein [Bifidobacterium angulatum]|uniref:cytidylate kinase-like family protein n=2 Tax=Bifidobacterium angulatum TaxID=1683 RepID=UPI0030B7FB19
MRSWVSSSIRRRHSGRTMLSKGTSRGMANRVISLQYQAMHKMAEKSSCVIIGRSANYLLHDRDDLINIFIYAPEEDRIRAVMEHQSVSEAKAREIISYNDERNRSRHQYIIGTNRGDRSQRDLLINSSMLGWEKTCQYLLLLVEMMNE